MTRKICIEVDSDVTPDEIRQMAKDYHDREIACIRITGGKYAQYLSPLPE